MKSCVSDGAAAMLGVHNGMVMHIQEKVPDLIKMHCVCHRLALACVVMYKELLCLQNQMWKFNKYFR